MENNEPTFKDFRNWTIENGISTIDMMEKGIDHWYSIFLEEWKSR